MIRFSCPGCEATFNVSDDKAGKTGKCPKCNAQFTIPLAPDGQSGGADLPPPLPPAADGGAVEIAPCPKCGARLSVEAGDIGLEVECPTCRAVYPAEPLAGVAAPKPKVGSKSSMSVGSGSKRSLVVREEDDDEPPRRSRRRDEDDDRPVRSSRRDEIDDEDEPPRKKKKKKRRSDIESKRVTAALLAWFLGWLGVHKFYLGYTTAGVILLIGNLCTCFTVLWIVNIIEAIIYISKSDEDFIETYQVGQKEWF